MNVLCFVGYVFGVQSSWEWACAHGSAPTTGSTIEKEKSDFTSCPATPPFTTITQRKEFHPLWFTNIAS